ncbi:MAG: DUF305 domain-containing protein [Gordonia sp.]|uniref:DUF305 domain-containing protein n=1 Tax=Gordonia sp. (in: high G+C Gram-positive bacteria) TaxID=84139 RepID=UPI000C436D0E|nr:DUF305 domain-containing protein [Gordonia sp. (in: high G+C Gram-positive bacteria)]MAU80321.1 DUF305 domain-containing protein [Gordonia sp. (in: high G+C Gram-positive bacteria)]
MKRQIFVGAAVAAVALLGACSDVDDAAPPSSVTAVTTTTMPMEPSAESATESSDSRHNDADVTFNQEMIPHHMQALMMADLVADRTTTPAVRDLADRIRAAQKPEIDEMTARLTSWGVSSEMGGHSGAHGAGGHDMSGMMTPQQMAALSQAEGTDFDRMWLEGMIAHHEGAIAMADTELADGVNGPSRELAKRVKSAQQAEIDEMNSILRR